jgi:hypothetical protein
MRIGWTRERKQFLKTGVAASVGQRASLSWVVAAVPSATKGGDPGGMVQPPTPEWAQDLIVCEIAGPGFAYRVGYARARLQAATAS